MVTFSCDEQDCEWALDVWGSGDCWRSAVASGWTEVDGSLRCPEHSRPERDDVTDYDDLGGALWDAIQWTGDNWVEVEAFTSDPFAPKSFAPKLYDVQVLRYPSGLTEVFDSRLVAWVPFEKFDWIFRGPEGECYLVEE